jgi:HEAT repeat protein
MHFFCPSCWHEVGEKETVCPLCKAPLNILDDEPFVSKLLRALHSPEPETVLRAVFILGVKHQPETLPDLTEMLLKTDNIFVQEALIMALCKFRDPRVNEIIKNFAIEKHAIIVRNAVNNCLKSYNSQTNNP